MATSDREALRRPNENAGPGTHPKDRHHSPETAVVGGFEQTQTTAPDRVDASGSWRDRLPIHPAADLLPLMAHDELLKLGEDIKANGIQVPIGLWAETLGSDFYLLDGRNRLDAMEATGQEIAFDLAGAPQVPTEVAYGDREAARRQGVRHADPLSFVLSRNLHRRHLTAQQRHDLIAAVLIAKPEASNRKIAAEVKAHHETVGAVRKDLESTGEIRQLETTIGRDGKARTTAPKSRVIEKAQRRAEREVELSKRIIALPNKKYGVILADPEWRLEAWSEGGMGRSADNHYPTSTLDEIKARDVPSIAADDCVLFLWATVPMLPQALEVMKAWGFAYKSNLCWVKDKQGTGYWSRNKHEHLLIGTKGSIPAPAHGPKPPSAIEAPVGAHSAKPEAFHELIESYFPNLPKIELNRRGAPRPGWCGWGLECEASPDSEPEPEPPPAPEDAGPEEIHPVAEAGPDPASNDLAAYPTEDEIEELHAYLDDKIVRLVEAGSGLLTLPYKDLKEQIYDGRFPLQTNGIQHPILERMKQARARGPQQLETESVPHAQHEPPKPGYAIERDIPVPAARRGRAA